MNIRTNVPDDLSAYQSLYDDGDIGELARYALKLVPPFSDVEEDVMFVALDIQMKDGQTGRLVFFATPTALRQLSDAMKRAYLEIPGGDLESLPQ